MRLNRKTKRQEKIVRKNCKLEVDIFLKITYSIR